MGTIYESMYKKWYEWLIMDTENKPIVLITAPSMREN